ncbi:MAG TPA: DUF1223 domain-containing protein [Verrucomicrobiae bacterium]
MNAVRHEVLTIGISILAFATFATTALGAEPIVFQSAQRQTSLVELYTSEGCSSCPPAEQWLSRLKDSSGLWTDFVPIAFHVDYWNSLGWRDRWSDERFSDRQRDYAQAWKSEDIYTPEFVLNGKEWRRGFWNRSVPASSETNAGLLKVTSDDATHWHLTFTPPTGAERAFEAHAALLVSGVSSDVTGGENASRHLNHDFVAIAFIEVPAISRSNIFQATFVLNPPEPKPTGKQAMAVWITPVGKSDDLLQATGGWLNVN